MAEVSLHCHHQNDFCIKMGSDESYFNVSVGSDGQRHKTVSTNHNLFEEKGEPKRYRTEVLPLTSLTPYHWAKPAHRWFCSSDPDNVTIICLIFTGVSQNNSEFRSSLTVEVAVLGSPSLKILLVSVDVKQH